MAHMNEIRNIVGTHRKMSGFTDRGCDFKKTSQFNARHALSCLACGLAWTKGVLCTCPKVRQMASRKLSLCTTHVRPLIGNYLGKGECNSSVLLPTYSVIYFIVNRGKIWPTCLVYILCSMKLNLKPMYLKFIAGELSQNWTKREN